METTPITFSCSTCGERHKKYLPETTSVTTCNKCGNLIEISSRTNQQYDFRNNLNSNSNNYRNNRRRNNDPFSFDSDNDNNRLSNNGHINNYLDSDFYDFNRYSGHNDYLPSRGNSEHNSGINDLSELNDNLMLDEFDRFYSGNIINNNPQSRVFRQTNTRYNFSNVNSNQGINRPFDRVNQRSLSINQGNNNRNNNQNNGMFSIQIPNDSYDRFSALNHRSNFGYRGEDNILRDFEELNDIGLQQEMESDFELMSRLDEHNPLRRVGLVRSLVIKPAKPKIKLEKIKMTKDLLTKNDGNKNEAPVCCICLAPIKINQDVTLLKCQHLYHFKCLEKWVQNKEACPFCRGKIEFAKIKKKNKDKKEDLKVEDKKININNLNIRPVIGERKTNVIRANNSILNTNKKKKKNNNSKK